MLTTRTRIRSKAVCAVSHHLTILPHVRDVVYFDGVALPLYADDTNVTPRSGSIQLATRKLNSATKKLEPYLDNGESMSVNVPSY